MSQQITRRCVALVLVFLWAPCLRGQTLDEGFRNPPGAARPLTWWHWLDGNITREGITADLEAMNRAGLGGTYLFNCGVGMPQGPVRFMQPDWLEMVDHAVSEAKRLGLKFGVHNCDGFSQSGGPWITPENSMKELTWSVTDIEGPTRFEGILAQPPSKEGFYRDIAVIAFPLPQGRRLTGPGTKAALRGSLPAEQLARLTDGRPTTTVTFPPSPGDNAIEFVFSEPQTVRSVVCRNASPHRWEEDFPIRLEASSDGVSFRAVGSLTVNWDMSQNDQITAACDESTARVFRLSFHNPWPATIGEVELSDAAKVHFAEAKAARLRSRGHGAERRHYDASPGPSRRRMLPPALVVARDAVKDISAEMSSGGQLEWEVPAGRWRILRAGFTSNGHRVSPATPEGRGLECDKLERQGGPRPPRPLRRKAPGAFGTGGRRYLRGHGSG